MCILLLLIKTTRRLHTVGYIPLKRENNTLKIDLRCFWIFNLKHTNLPITVKRIQKTVINFALDKLSQTFDTMVIRYSNIYRKCMKFLIAYNYLRKIV